MTTLNTSKPQPDTEVDAAALASNFIAIEAVVNGSLDQSNWGSGDIFPANQITQSGAAVGDSLVWNGSEWAPGLGGAPTGSVIDFAGSSAPTGWLLCDGTEVSRTTYAALDAVITTTYGSYTNGSGGAGTTHFRLPNAKGRVSVHKDSGQTEFDALGETNSSATKTHTLTAAELASHTHSGTTGDDSPDHTHGTPWGTQDADGGLTAGGQAFGGNVTSTGASVRHQHAFTTSSQSGSPGSAHNNLQPYIVFNKIIKT